MNKIIGRRTIAESAKKITLKISANDFVVSVICFCLSRARILTYMNPFGMAAYASMFSNTGWFYALLCTIAGIVLSKGDYTSVRYILALGVATPVLGLSERRSNTMFKAAVISISYFAVSLSLLIAEGFLLYDFIYFSFEAFICFVCVFLIDDVIPVITSYNSRVRLSVREITSLACMAALLVLSCGSLPSFFGMNLSSLIAIFIILAVNLKGDCMMGAAVGVVMGVAVSMGNYESVSVVGAYAIASFLAGMFKKYSRLGVLLGFTLANAVVTAFLNDSGMMLINPIEVLVAGFVFVTMRRPVLKLFTDFTQKASGVYADSVNTAVVSGDSAVSTVYRQCGELSGTLSDLSAIYAHDCKPKRPGKRYINELFNKCADSVCNGCGLRFGCWSSVTHNNYEYMMSMFEQANKNGSVDLAYIPKKFADRCIKKEEFVRAFNFVYKIYQSDKLWLDKTYRLQKLMSGQLGAVAHSLKQIQNNSLLVCNAELSSELACALDRYNCKPCNVAVFNNGDEINSVSVDFSIEKFPEGYSENMATIISYTLDKPFVYNGEYNVGDDKKNMMFVPSKKYAVSSAHLQMQKNGEYVCGDCVTELNNAEGKYIMVISDGMGSGNAAHSESKATVAMFTRLIEAGTDVDTAVELVNTSLVVRSQKDCFATIDVLCVDMNSGKITISKVGAAPTYISKEGVVKKIECSSLPAGILADIQTQHYAVEADDKTVVVMMSDGISNTTLKNVYEQDWICTELKNISSDKAEVISRHIMNSAIMRYGGKCTDDITIGVAIIYKNE